MDRRRIIAFGKDSYALCLPKKWVKANDLGKGDYLYVDNSPNELLLKPTSESVEKKKLTILINVKDKAADRIRTEIVSAYLCCADIIEIRGDNVSKRSRIIKDTVNNLAGVEVNETSANKMVVKNQVFVPMLIRRIDIIIRSMLDESLKSKITQDIFDELFERDKDINRLVFLVYRMLRFISRDHGLAASMNIDPNDVQKLSLIVLRMEKIGDCIKRIARIFKSISIEDKARKEINSIYEDIVKLYKEVMKSYYDNDIDTLFKAESGSKMLISELNKFLKKHHTVDIANATEYMKGILSHIKHMARTMIAGIG